MVEFGAGERCVLSESEPTKQPAHAIEATQPRSEAERSVCVKFMMRGARATDMPLATMRSRAIFPRKTRERAAPSRQRSFTRAWARVHSAPNVENVSARRPALRPARERPRLGVGVLHEGIKRGEGSDEARLRQVVYTSGLIASPREAPADFCVEKFHQAAA